jgi:hypothetical protein
MRAYGERTVVLSGDKPVQFYFSEQNQYFVS